jgi:hypothetical protein
MARSPSVLCKNCGTHALEWRPDADGGEGGYLCPSWRSYEDGVGCSRVISLEEFEDQCEDAFVDDDDDDGVEEKETEEDDDDDDESDSPGEDRKAENVAALLRLESDLVVSFLYFDVGQSFLLASFRSRFAASLSCMSYFRLMLVLPVHFLL